MLIPFRIEKIAIILIIFINLTMIFIYHDNLFGHHSFRQSQTALAVSWLISNPFEIDYLPVFGHPWKLPMEFPFYQIIIAIFSQLSGITHTLIAKVFNIIFTLLSLKNLSIVVPKENRNRFFIYTLTCPLVFYYCSAYLIEAFCVFLLSIIVKYFHKQIYNFSFKNSIFMGLIISFLALQKITYIIPLLPIICFFYISLFVKNKINLRELILNGILILVALIPFLIWNQYSVDVKSMNYLTSLETGSANWRFIFGEIIQRFDLFDWSIILKRFMILGGGGLVILFILKKINLKPKITPILFIYSLTSLLIFFNLYVVHDYYLYSLVIIFTTLIFSFRVIQWDKLYLILIASNIIVCLIWAVPKIISPADDVKEVLQISKEINKRKLSSDNILVIIGNEWDSTIAYKTNLHTIHIPSSTNGRLIDFRNLTKNIHELYGNLNPYALIVCSRWLKYYSEEEYRHYRDFFEFTPVEGTCLINEF